MRSRLPATRVLSAFRRASSSPVLVETPGGLFVTKLVGAGQGAAALIAEVIVAEIAEVVGLPVPERAVIELPWPIPSDDRKDELLDLLSRSAGQSLGFRFLDGATDARAADLDAVDDDFALRLLWLDGLVMNPDRTPQNINLLLWKKQVWLIDHGAALPFQHAWSSVTEASPREPDPSIHRHIFSARSALLAGVDRELAGLVSRDVLRAAVDAVPDSFLKLAAPGEDVTRARRAYEAFLWKRLKAPRPFITVKETH